MLVSYAFPSYFNAELPVTASIILPVEPPFLKKNADNKLSGFPTSTFDDWVTVGVWSLNILELSTHSCNSFKLNDENLFVSNLIVFNFLIELSWFGPKNL